MVEKSSQPAPPTGALIAYIKVLAVKNLIVGSREWAGGMPQGEPPPVTDLASKVPPDTFGWVSSPLKESRVFTLKKMRVFKARTPKLGIME